ncbi:MAG: hypothetical protein ACT4N2_15535 [Hyphomicrobium sp.]
MSSTLAAVTIGVLFPATIYRILTRRRPSESHRIGRLFKGSSLLFPLSNLVLCLLALSAAVRLAMYFRVVDPISFVRPAWIVTEVHLTVLALFLSLAIWTAIRLRLRRACKAGG